MWRLEKRRNVAVMRVKSENRGLLNRKNGVATWGSARLVLLRPTSGQAGIVQLYRKIRQDEYDHLSNRELAINQLCFLGMPMDVRASGE